MRDRTLAGGPVVAATKKKKKKKRHPVGGYRGGPSGWRARVRAGAERQQRDNGGGLDVDQEEGAEEAEEGSRSLGADRETSGLEVKKKKKKRRKRKRKRKREEDEFGDRRDRPATSWTGRPREFSC